MAREIVCCNGCGRDVDITRRSKKNPPIYCTRCSDCRLSKNRYQMPSEEIGRKLLFPPGEGLPRHDNYNEDSEP
jgi:DNA-directed RNA polymerase subunit RPC12/RpoP